jgi:hypothetical protein
MPSIISTFPRIPVLARCLTALLLLFSLVAAGAGESVYSGTSPCEAPIRDLLGINDGDSAEIIEWNLVLNFDSTATDPSKYELRATYGRTVPNQPGLAGGGKTIVRKGSCKISKGIKNDPEARVIELSGALNLQFLTANLLHILNADRSLMVGHGGWSYTLNNALEAEKVVPPDLAATAPDMSYTIAPLASGPEVFAIFEGRTPCLGIAKELKIPVHSSASKAKWRLTLYQNPQTQAPTTYKIEGTLFRPNSRQGTWSVVTQGKQKFLKLDGAAGEQTIHLKQGDENVLFFVHADFTYFIGSSDFSYTLNRKPPASSLSKK